MARYWNAIASKNGIKVKKNEPIFFMWNAPLQGKIFVGKKYYSKHMFENQ